MCTCCWTGFGPAPTEFDVFTQLMATDGPRFALEDSEDAASADERIALLRDFLFMDPTLTMSKTVAHNLSMLMERAPSRSWKPRIELGVTVSLRETSTLHLREYARLFEDFAAREQQKTAGGSAFRFEITTLWLTSAGRLLSDIDAQILSDMITAESATIRHVVIENAMATLEMGETLTAYQQFLRATVCVSDDATTGLQTLHIYKAPIAAYGHLMAVCSALRYKNSLTELSVEWSSPISRYLFDKSALLWAWIAFGIFHPDSEAKLDVLGLACLPLRRRVDMEAFESVLRTPHPGRLLWLLDHGELPQGKGLDEEALPTGQRVMLELKSKTKLRELAKPRSPVLHEVDKYEPEEFEAAILLSNWACVIVPGVGLCWAPVGSVVSRRNVPSKCADTTSITSEGDTPSRPPAIAAANVRTFRRAALPRRVVYFRDSTRVFDDDNNRSGADDTDNVDVGTATSGGAESDFGYFPSDSLADIKSLLRMIGHVLEGFEYPLHDIEISERDLSEILESCPNLRKLNLQKNRVAGITPLLYRYRSGLCQIANLSIDSNVEVDRIAAHMAQLLKAPFSKPLQFLEFNGQVISNNNDHLAILGRALNSNRTLELLSIMVKGSASAKKLLDEQVAPKRVLRSKLSLAMKIAFLSVIHEHATRLSHASRLASLAKLDSGVVAEIFGFAGSPAPRTVVVRGGVDEFAFDDDF